MYDDEMDIEILELDSVGLNMDGLNLAKKLKRLGINTIEDLKKKEIPKDIPVDKLKVEGLDEKKISKLKNEAKEKKDITRKEKATVGTMFLGPQGENADLLEKIIVDVLRDHIFWRRNFHPEDRFSIREEDKATQEFEENKTKMFQQLYDLLRRLKRNNIPICSPRYLGHMLSDPLLTGIVGYFSAMLYNPNNVTKEASPETTDLEIEFGKELAALLGYQVYIGEDLAKKIGEQHINQLKYARYNGEEPKTLLYYKHDDAWGHICSGGTVANLEAIWVARNLKYLPISIRKVFEEDKDLFDEFNKNIKNKHFSHLLDQTAWKLLNLNPKEVLDMHQTVLQIAEKKGKLQDVEAKIKSYNLSELGMQGFIEKNKQIFKDTKPGVVIVPSTAHYSLKKVAEILGIGTGEEQLIRIPVRNFRMDAEKLKEKLDDCLKNNIPVIAVVSVCGSTEEGAIDPIDEVKNLREKFEGNGLSFYHHCDAAYGGYLRCLFREEDYTENYDTKYIDKHQGRMRDFSEDKDQPEWPSTEIIKALKAISEADSVTIDPHKLGYIPYPAGAVVFKDGRMKWEISYSPAYLELPFIGKYSVEGSKPGAAAAACWLSMKVFPFNKAGHGTLITRTIKNTYTVLAVLHDLETNLQHELKEELEFEGKVKLKVLNDPPDLNMLCFLINWIQDKAEDGGGLLRMNCFAEKVYNDYLKFNEKRALSEHKFIVSSTKFKFDEYGEGMGDHLESIGIEPNNFKSKPESYNAADVNCCDDEIFVLRCTIWNPWLAVKGPETKIYYMVQLRNDFKEAIKNVVNDPQSLEKAIKDKINERTNKRRSESYHT